MTQGSNISSLSYGEDSSTYEFVSTITSVPPSIDVIVPEPPPAEPPTPEEQQTMESRIAMKIVEERIAHHKQNDEEETEEMTKNPSRETSKGGLTSVAEETTTAIDQEQQLHQSTPGAVRVAGMNSRSTLEESVVSNQTRGMETSQKSTSTPFEPEVPVEAQLVKDESSKSNEVVQAQAVDAAEFGFKDAVRNPKICGAFVLIMLAMTTLAVGLSVGLTRRSATLPADDPVPESPPNSTSNNTNTTFIHTTIQTPFTNRLLDISIEIIVSEATSPQALANTWMLRDPNLDSYSTNRSLARFALATLFFATNGPRWVNKSEWLSYEVHECEWYMSHYESPCDDEGRHVILNLTGNALNGTANTRELLLYLWKVHSLDVSNNSLVGSPPPLLGEREGLIHLDYSGNYLRGIISAEFGWRNENLQVMRIHDNFLSGEIPPNLYAILPNAAEINLAGNEFVGTIPGQLLTNNTQLKILNLEENQLEGTLPSSLEHLLELEVLDVSGNHDVTGTIPNELESCSDLEVLDIEDTSLTGSVPEGLCRLEASKQLHVVADCDEVVCC